MKIVTDATITGYHCLLYIGSCHNTYKINTMFMSLVFVHKSPDAIEGELHLLCIIYQVYTRPKYCLQIERARCRDFRRHVMVTS